MNRSIFNLAGVFFLVAVTTGLTQEPQAAPAADLPAATASEFNCTGFLAPHRISKDLYVLDGADNDLHDSMRQFAPGAVVYLRSRRGETLAVGAEYALVRRAGEHFHTPWYPWQRWKMRALGVPYQDIGRVKVVRITTQGALAEVIFACGPISRNDIALPYQPFPAPRYIPTAELDRFAPPNGKLTGNIAAAALNPGALATGNIAYLNLGETSGARAGQRYRIFRISTERTGGEWAAFPETPRETVGELIVLYVLPRSAVAIVVSSVREIFPGDGIELE